MMLPLDKRAWPGMTILIITGTVLDALMHEKSILYVFLILAAGHAYFLRNPFRAVPAGDAPLAPADGVVVEITALNEPRFLKEEAVRISIFLSVLVPHINRAPSNGIVEFLDYAPGKFYNALDKRSAGQNESNWIGIRDGKGRPILIRQIAGIIARRIYCDVKEGDQVIRGKNFGVICYSSRAEIYLPKRLFKENVSVGDHLKTGQSLLGEWLS